MSTKPSSVATWASAGPITVPTGGKQAAGFGGGERGAAQYLNWLHNLAGLWEQYLNDGAMSGAFTFDNTVEVTGVLTALDKVYATTGFYGAAGATALFPAGLQSTTLGFTTSRSVAVPALSAVDVSAAHTRAADHFVLAGNSDVIVYPIVLPVGSVLSHYSIIVNKQTDNTNTISGRLYSTGGTGSNTALATGFTDNGNASGFGTLRGETVSITIAAGLQYYFQFTPGGGTSPAADALYHLNLTYTRP